MHFIRQILCTPIEIKEGARLAYEKITFVNDGPPAINATALNQIQTQYDEAKSDLNAHLAENAIDAHEAIPAASVYHNVDVVMSDSTDVFIPFNSEYFDTDNIHDTETNNTRLTCQTPGKYLIIGQVAWPPNSDGTRTLGIRLNGDTILSQVIEAPPQTAPMQQVVSTIWEMNTGDYVELRVHQTSGSSLTLSFVGGHSPRFMMVKVG